MFESYSSRVSVVSKSCFSRIQVVLQSYPSRVLVVFKSWFSRIQAVFESYLSRMAVEESDLLQSGCNLATNQVSPSYVM